MQYWQFSVGLNQGALCISVSRTISELTKINRINNAEDKNTIINA